LRPDRLDLPLKVKKPTVWAVWNDLFHEDVPFNFIEECLESFSFSRQHIFMILTKRAERMKVFFDWLLSVPGRNYLNVGNVWLGVTAENQEMANKRIPLLLQIPAAVRFVSVEPLLGSVNLYPRSWLFRNCEQEISNPDYSGKPGVNWVICGGESGPHARPMHPDWARGLRDQCVASQTPFFFKQWGEWAPGLYLSEDYRAKAKQWGTLDDEGNWFPLTTPWNGRQGDDSPEREYVMCHVGKKAAGRILDGQEWLQVPEAKGDEQ
jgi:protein gp37